MTSPTSRPPFTWRSFRAGLLGGLILTSGVALCGVTVGAIARAVRLSVAEAVLMSA